MTEETAKKARDILNKLDEYKKFLKRYDECQHKTITIKIDFLSSLGDTLDFSYDEKLKDIIREYVVHKIEGLKKQLEELK